MRVFLTGASGFIGSRVLQQLIAQGDDVRALVRTEAQAQAVSEKGAHPVQGDLTSLQVISEQAAAADAVIHTAFIHDFARWEDAHVVDIQVSEAIIAALEGTNKPFIATSGSGVLGDTGGSVDESHPIPADYPLAGRAKNENVVLKGGERGVRAIVLRLPLYVYDKDGSIFSRIQDQVASGRGFATYFDEGSYAASTVHVEDVASLYVLAVKHGKAGSLYHGTNGSATGRQIAEAIASKQGSEAKSAPSEEAQQLYGPVLALFFTMTNLNDSKKARSELQWQPKLDIFLDSVAGKVQ